MLKGGKKAVMPLESIPMIGGRRKRRDEDEKKIENPRVGGGWGVFV